MSIGIHRVAVDAGMKAIAYLLRTTLSWPELVFL